MVKVDKLTKRWIRTASDELAIRNGCRFNEERAMLIVDFFGEFLTHGKPPHYGKPFIPLEWESDGVLMPLFGWERQDDETGFWVRRFVKAYISAAKKNGKTSVGAGICLFGLVADGMWNEFGDFVPETETEIYSVATSFKTAADALRIADGMVQRNSTLSAVLSASHHQKSVSSISYDETGGLWSVLSVSERSNQGQNAAIIFADELHEWYGEENYNALRYAGSGRQQPLFMQFTTAGDDHQSVCFKQYEYAKAILDGTIKNDAYFTFITEADPKDDPLDPTTWTKANPSLGVAITTRAMRNDAVEAAKSPESLAAFRRYRCNVWTTGIHPWLDINDWLACAGEWLLEELKGKECYAALDLSRTRDSTSLQLVFPWANETIRLLSFFYLPEETARKENHRVSWLVWADEGYVILTPGNVCDYTYVYKDIKRLSSLYKIKELTFDPYNAEQLTQEVEETIGLPRFSFGQTIMNYAAPTAEFERLVLSKKVSHLSNPCMDWQIGNTRVKMDVNANKRPVKPTDVDHRKIDGPAAAIMGVGRWMVGEEYETESVYETRGMRMV